MDGLQWLSQPLIDYTIIAKPVATRPNAAEVAEVNAALATLVSTAGSGVGSGSGSSVGSGSGTATQLSVVAKAPLCPQVYVTVDVNPVEQVKISVLSSASVAVRADAVPATSTESAFVGAGTALVRPSHVEASRPHRSPSR